MIMSITFEHSSKLSKIPLPLPHNNSDDNNNNNQCYKNC